MTQTIATSRWWRAAVVGVGLMMLFQTSAGTASAAYFTNCATTYASGVYVDWTFVKRDLSSPGMTGVLSNIRVRTLNPCVEVLGVGDSTGAAVTLQYNTTNTQRIVQLGYQRCGVTAGCGGDANPGTKVPKDGNVHFWYTKNDAGSGRAYLADGWYQTPDINDEYRMKVESQVNGSGDPQWRYCIRNITEGAAYDCTTTPRTWGTTTGTRAWWGTETHNTKSQNGNADNVADLNIRPQYERNGQDNWYYTTQNACFIASTGPNGAASYPGYYECAPKSIFDADGDGSVNDLDGLWSWTSNH